MDSIIQKRSRFIVMLLFLISLIFSIGIAQIAVSSPPPLTFVKQAQQHYQAAQFPQAIQEWQQAAEAFAEQGDRLNQAMALGNLALSHQSLGQWNEASSAIATRAKPRGAWVGPVGGGGGSSGRRRRRRERAMALNSPSRGCISPRLGRVMDHSRGRCRAGASSTSWRSRAMARRVASRQARRLRQLAAAAALSPCPI